MKSENSNGKLLLGIGLGVLAGVAVTYLMNGEHRRKLEEDLNEVGHGIKDGVKSALQMICLRKPMISVRKCIVNRKETMRLIPAMHRISIRI